MSIKQLSIRSYFASPTPASPTPASAPAPGSPTPASAPTSAPASASSLAPASPALPPPASPCIPREASIRPVKADDVSALRRINSLLLQVTYPEAFYASAIDNPLCRVVTYMHPGQPPKIVGGIVCRDEGGPAGIYIRSLAVLSPYRGMGLAASALEDIARGEGRGTKLTAHVWTENEDALRWYEARGFRRDGPVVSGYYLKLRPDSAWLMTRDAAAATRPAMPAAPATSFQNQRPHTEWNDLPDDMAPPPPLPLARSSPASSPGSSRSSSTAAGPRRKKDRTYPAAAFGNS